MIFCSTRVYVWGEIGCVWCVGVLSTWTFNEVYWTSINHEWCRFDGSKRWRTVSKARGSEVDPSLLRYQLLSLLTFYSPLLGQRRNDAEMHAIRHCSLGELIWIDSALSSCPLLEVCVLKLLKGLSESSTTTAQDHQSSKKSRIGLDVTSRCVSRRWLRSGSWSRCMAWSWELLVSFKVGGSIWRLSWRKLHKVQFPSTKPPSRRNLFFGSLRQPYQHGNLDSGGRRVQLYRRK